MPTLGERIRRASDLSPEGIESLRTLVSSWQVLADLSFSDLLLYVKAAGQEVWHICAQVRPFTSQTLYPQDMIGTKVTQPEQPIVERAWREGLIWAQKDPVMVDGIPIRMFAVPVRRGGEVIGVLTMEGTPAISRRLGHLEQRYLEAADQVARMISDGTFPYPDVPDREWPRIGDGLFVLDGRGRIKYASPNALSNLRRIGVSQNLNLRRLDDLGVGETPVGKALVTRRLLDGELVSGITHIFLRVMPLVDSGVSVGALVLARDVSELRQKERVISVKDATIREIHHRVKNNLQTIASLLRLQSRRLHSEEAKAALRESVLRVGSIALVHETLSEQPSDVAEFGDVARRISHMVSEALLLPGRHFEIKVTGATGPLAADIATPLAVTVTELLQNAVEHAFPDGHSGTIGVDLNRSPDFVIVTVWDDGVGISPPLYDGVLQGSRLGLQIVRSLIEELGGKFEIMSTGGTSVELRVPLSR